jgi:hypothetical protein
VDEK